MALPSTYIANVPQGNQQINNTQQPINGNFQDIYNLLAINHVPFNTANTFGRHTLVDYVFQGTDPSTLSTEMALYSKAVDNDPNVGELFYRYPNNGNIVQLTGVTSSQTGSGGSGLSSGGFFQNTTASFGQAAGGYWQYLSGNILYMSFTVSTYYATNPVPTNPYTITFPFGTYQNGVTVPTFSQPPFIALISDSGFQYTYAVTVTSNTTALIYNYQTVNPAPSTIASVYVTLIGI